MLYKLLISLVIVNEVHGFAGSTGGRRCFDAASTFTTPSGPKRMDAIAVGDEVLAARSDGSLVWDKIAADASHAGLDMTEYIELGTDASRTLTLTANHLVHATRDSTKTCCGADTLVAADKVAVGDTVWVATSTDGALTPARVTTVGNATRAGKYNFWLDQNDDAHFRSLIVNGVATVSFTDDFRLTQTLGFDVADRLVDPLRDMARMGITIPTTVSREAPWIGLAVQDVVADCVESHMAGCSDDELRSKLDTILQQGAAALGQAHMDSLLAAFEQLAARHLRAVPSSARRLAVRLGAMHVTALVAHEARSTAMHVCAADDECNRDMAINVQLHTSGYLGGPLQILTVALGVAVAVLLVVVATLACVVRRIVIGLTRNLSASTKVAVVAPAPVVEAAATDAKTDADVAEQV